MKKLLIIFLAAMALSCSKDDEREIILDPQQQYFIISEGETKVNTFKIEFQGIYSVNYTIYSSELDEDINQVKKEAIKTGTIEVNGVETFQYNSGFVIFEYKIQDIEKAGELKIILNENEVLVPEFFADELNMDFQFSIPYKY